MNVFASNEEENKNIHYKQSYKGNVELSCGVKDTWSFLTSHGYSFGNGLYLGGGSGFSAEFLPEYDSNPRVLLPLFADLKYSFCNSVVSPFVGVRAGGYAHVNSEEVEGVRVFIYFTKACLYPFCKFQYPLVKSGISTGILPFSIERRESSIIEHHSARS